MTRSSPDSALLPCPFCGRNATMEQTDYNRWSVGCDAADEPSCIGYQSFTTFARRSEAVEAWNRRAPAQAAPIDEALRNAFPHFQDDSPITPEAIKAIGKEYVDMIMGWEPQQSEIEFIDHDGNTHKIVYEAGDGDAPGGWALSDDLPVPPQAAQRSALESALEYVEADLMERFSISGQNVRDELRAALAAQPQGAHDYRQALENARQEIVYAIAFLGRDVSTKRLDITASQLYARLAKADAAILETLSRPQQR